VDNNKMNLRDIGWGGIGLIALAQDREHWRVHLNTLMNLRVTVNAGKFFISYTAGGFIRMLIFIVLGS
jgi:hypothetical protein